MKTCRLNTIQNWSGLARQANWSVAELAKRCGVSVRTLRRYIQKTWRQAPKTWLAGHRQKHAMELLCDGSSVKETAARVGYQNSETFSREFKKRCGKCPVEIARMPTVSPAPREQLAE